MNINSAHRKLTFEQVQKLRDPATNMTQITKEMGISHRCAYNARFGKTYADLNDALPIPAPRVPEPKTVAEVPVVAGEYNPASDGGQDMLDSLEGMLLDYRQLTEKQWAMLHRLRKALKAEVYFNMRNKPGRPAVGF